MSDSTHLFDRQQAYPLLALITWRPGVDTTAPVAGWCLCGSAMVVDDRGMVSCVTLARAQRVEVHLPETIENMQAYRYWERRDFARSVKADLRAI